MQASAERTSKVKFVTQADPDVLENLRNIAASEGRQIQSLVDEALREYIERKQSNTPRRHVMQALQGSMDKYGCLYKELAK